MDGPIPELASIAYIRTVEGQLQQIDARLKELAPKKKDNWDRFQSISTFLSGLLVLLASLLITNRVEQSLKERTLTFQNVKEMQPLLLKIDPSATPADARSAALALATYGKYSVPSFIQMLQNNPIEHREAALAGLRAAGALDHRDTCKLLTAVINNRTGLYTCEVHENSARLLGDLNCAESARSLKAYLGRIEAATPANAPFGPVPGTTALTPVNIQNVRSAAKRSLDAIAEASPE